MDEPEKTTQILHTGQAAEGPEHPSSQEEQIPAPVVSKQLGEDRDAPGSSTSTQGLPQPGKKGAADSPLHFFHGKIQKCILKNKKKILH